MGRDMRNKRVTRQSKRRQDAALPFVYEDTSPRYEKVEKPKTLTPKNEAQKNYLGSLKTSNLVFAIGPAGTGKTFMAAWFAAELFDRGEIDKIVVTRPVVEAGEELGFLPGELEEKVAPYFMPVKEALERRLGKGRVEYMLKAKQLVFEPLAYMRGRTFDDTCIILDEAQNTTPKQMKMFLTRIGEGTKVIVDGDPRQTDIVGPNGLLDAIDRLENLPQVHVCRFTRADVVRSGLAQVIVDAYEGEDAQPLPKFITG